MGHVYGDSTPFPFDINFVELIRHAVECGVTLMARAALHRHRRRPLGQLRPAAQAGARAHGRHVGRDQADDDGVHVVALGAHGAHGVARARVGARRHRERAGDARGAGVGRDLEHPGHGRARRARPTFRAVEAFVLRHDLPNTSVGLRLLAGEETYSGQALVATPFGIEAVFALAIPPAHDWGKIRRVAELSAGTEVHIPQESGWLSKRVAVAPVKLDKLVVTEVAMASDRSLITLRKGPRSGAGFQLEVTRGRAAEGDDPAARRGRQPDARSGDRARRRGRDARHAAVESRRRLDARPRHAPAVDDDGDVRRQAAARDRGSGGDRDQADQRARADRAGDRAALGRARRAGAAARPRRGAARRDLHHQGRAATRRC